VTTSMCAFGCTWPSDLVAMRLWAPAPCSIIAAAWEQGPQRACTEERVLGLPMAAVSRHLDLERCQLRLLLVSYPHHAEHKGSKN